MASSRLNIMVFQDSDLDVSSPVSQVPRVRISLRDITNKPITPKTSTSGEETAAPVVAPVVRRPVKNTKTLRTLR
jgi:hypothetical protein